MSIQPIDIQIEDNSKYCYVAYLVDREDFLKDIQDVRKQLSLKTMPYKFPRYPYDGTNRIIGKYYKGILSINDVRVLLEEMCFKEKLMNIIQLDKTFGTAVQYAESLTGKYRSAMHCFPVILSSILTGKVNEFDFLTTYCLELNDEDMPVISKDIERYGSKVTIVVNPETTNKELLDIFDYIKKHEFRMKKIDKDTPSEYMLPDVISNIKRDRKWYWQNKQGESAFKIFKGLEKQGIIIEQKTIEKAITQYRKRLQTPLE